MFKRISKIKIVSFILAVLMSVSCLSFINTRVNGQTATAVTRSTYDKYCYAIEDSFDCSVDSFSAWIKVPLNSLGGVIMGNYQNVYSEVAGSTNWEIDAAGRVKLFWANGTYTYTFNNAHVDDNKWHYISVIRDADNSKLYLYLDGELVEEVNASLTYIPCEMHYKVGVDHKNWNTLKDPFDGFIKQITLYNGAISQDRIRSDMGMAEITDTLNGQLIGNWYFGKNWLKDKVIETSGSGNDAVINTYEKYVDYDSQFEYDYSFIVFPDIQATNYYREYDAPASDTVATNNGTRDWLMGQKYNYRLTQMMQWVADNTSSLKAGFGLFVGDLSDRGKQEPVYLAAANAIDKLNNVLPYSVVQGNHDYDDDGQTRVSTYFNKHFPYSKHSQLPGFGGCYVDGDMTNTYYTYEVMGIKYMVLNLEFGPRVEVLRWAGRLCEKFYDHRVILNTHTLVDADGEFIDNNDRFDATRYPFINHGATTGKQVYEYLLSRYDNVFMAFSGHVGHDDLRLRSDIGDNGNKVHSVLCDFQVMEIDDGGIGEEIIVIVKVNERTKQMEITCYNPLLDKYFNIQNQMIVSFGDQNSPTIGI